MNGTTFPGDCPDFRVPPRSGGSKMGLSPLAADEMRALADMVCDGALREDDAAQLERLLRGNIEAQRFYLTHVSFDRRLRWVLTHEVPAPTAPPSSPVVLSLGSAGYDTAGFFSSGWPVAYLIATVIFGIGLLIGSHVYISGPEQLARQSAPLPSPAGRGAESMLPSPSGRGAGGEGSENVTHSHPVVGRITGMVDCQFDQPKAQDLRPKTVVSLGDKFALASGLMEITYDSGAKVILQGPVSYETEANGGYLSLGKLTGKLETKPQDPRPKTPDLSSFTPHPSSPSTNHYPLFTIKTPTATVTDLGTEFGVEVDAAGRMDVHVFRGVVECGTPATAGVAARTIRLTENSAVRIASGGANVERRRADRSQFATMPQRRPLSLVGFYPFDGSADDHSGNGNHVSPAKMHGITFVEGIEGQAAHFEPKAGSFIELPIDASPKAMPKLTWGAWVRPRAIGPDAMEILSTDTIDYGRTLTIDNRAGDENHELGPFRFAAFLGRAGLDRGVFPSTGSLPQPNAWTFVAAVYDDGVHRVSLYVEDKSLRNAGGGLVMDRTLGAEFGPCTPFIRVGRHITTNLFGPVVGEQPFDGDIDNIFVFREVLGMRELESIRKYGATAILALARGEALPAEDTRPLNVGSKKGNDSDNWCVWLLRSGQFLRMFLRPVNGC